MVIGNTLFHLKNKFIRVQIIEILLLTTLVKQTNGTEYNNICILYETVCLTSWSIFWKENLKKQSVFNKKKNKES